MKTANNQNTENLKISSPWVSYYHKLQALFGKDPDIHITYDNENIRIKMYVRGSRKYEALTQLLPSEMTFGNVTMPILVHPSNDVFSKAEIFDRAFAGNPLYEKTYEIKPEGSSNAFTYVMFSKEVVQYWDDNLGDPSGIVSTLAQEIAKEVLINDEGAYYCTDPCGPSCF